MNLAILGATGSIGLQTLDIVRASEGRFSVVTVTAHTSVDKLRAIIDEFHPSYVAVGLESAMRDLQRDYPDVTFGHGSDGLVTAATAGPTDTLVVNAIVGSAGLEPTIHAIKAGRNVALANKETLVIGGELIMPLLAEHHVRLLPIDSEHSAIMQLLDGAKHDTVRRIVITASGGSFRDKKRSELTTVTVGDALAHPNWTMGAKITIDSATMMNKGLEIIEAHHLFDLPYDQIDTVLHRESIVHSLVEFTDTALLAHLGEPDMRVPISYALHYPERVPFDGTRLQLETLGALHFEPLDEARYPMLRYAREAGVKGGYAPTVLNAANEAAVQLFLSGKITFLQIEEIVLQCVTTFQPEGPLTLPGILEVDNEVKDYVLKAYS